VERRLVRGREGALREGELEGQAVAGLAGLRAGDVIVEFAGAPVANLEEFAALLFGARAGERVEIVVEREGRRISTSALLGQRR
jgi:serine protease Do